MPQSKLTDYRLDCHLSVSGLAREAKVTDELIRKAERGEPIRADKARAIVQTLSRLLQQSITEQDAEINVL